jgi:hypothetical protein
MHTSTSEARRAGSQRLSNTINRPLSSTPDAVAGQALPVVRRTAAPSANGALFRFDQARFRYDPYPIGIIAPVLNEAIYTELLDHWPPTELFRCMSQKLGAKYSLSEKNHAPQYEQFVSRSPIWSRVRAEVKSESFILQVIDMLRANAVDLGLKDRLLVVNRRPLVWKHRLGDAWRALCLRQPRWVPVRSRFEFSMLPVDGGHVRPHTDGEQKFITLVVSMLRPEEWDPAFGGGTAILRPKDMTRNFNFVNDFLDFDETEELYAFPFRPNQCVVFVKTFNSLHAVPKMTGHGHPGMRKTLTINIELNA